MSASNSDGGAHGSSYPPVPQSDWAWFFDIDGTLADIERSPDLVQVDPAMRALVEALHARANGAVALISGRAVHDIDTLFPGLALAVAGQHGAERRGADGTVTFRAWRRTNLLAMRDALVEIERQYPGLLLEDKGLSLALHYRKAPELGEFVQDQVHALMVRYGEGFHMQQGKCVMEIVPLSINKGAALREFMSESPFAGRVPVFLGDDVTDENAFVMVNELGGYSVKVGTGKTHARACLRDVAAVREWLATAMPSISDKTTPRGDAA
jgi:trehalose 6-phosphate phosphatase